ncbi:MAG: hypothetical protein E3J72_00620 [Planctomycetota bacterium]|nr:MAG: hypothetical protein E3J72_00620 [Planctomycetota bacterium]
MPVILSEDDYHEINTRHELLRKGAAAFFGADFVVLASAVVLYISAGGWSGIRAGSTFWQVLYGFFVFLGFVTLVLVPVVNRFFGGVNLACPRACEIGAASRKLSLFVLSLSAASMLPVFCAFLLYFYTGSKISALLIGLCGTAAKIITFPKRGDIEKIVRQAKLDAGDVQEIVPGSGQYHVPGSGSFPHLPERQLGNGDVEMPARVRKRLEKSKDELESLMESGRLKRGFKDDSAAKQPPPGNPEKRDKG